MEQTPQKLNLICCLQSHFRGRYNTASSFSNYLVHSSGKTSHFENYRYNYRSNIVGFGEIVLGPRNRKRCRQTGSRQSTPLSTIRTRYGNSVSTPGATRTGKKQAEFSPKGKPIRNFSIDPTSSIRTPIADAFFADAISETPIGDVRNIPTQQLRRNQHQKLRRIWTGLHLSPMSTSLHYLCSTANTLPQLQVLTDADRSLVYLVENNMTSTS